MTIVLQEPWTVDRFLAWEDRQEGKHELDGQRILEMAGGSRAHQRIVANLLGSLLAALDPARFDVVHEMRIEVGSRIRYPDVSVVAAPLNDDVKTLRDALVLFEVLSRDTAETDTGVERAEYLLLPSIKRYVLVEQNRREIRVLLRGVSGWRQTLVKGDVELPEVGAVLSIDSVYQGIRL